MDSNLDHIIDSVGAGRQNRSVSSRESASQQSRKWWVAERAAPISSTYQEESSNKVKQEVERLRDHVETTSLALLDDEDNGAYGGLAQGGVSGAGSPQKMGDVKIQSLLIETELERVRYIARAYIRTRIAKIDEFRYFYLRMQDEQTRRNLPGIMSRDEWIYCHHHAESRAELHNNAFSNKSPAEYQDLTEVSDQAAMIDEPDSDKPVTVRALKPRNIAIQDDVVELVPGNIYLLRFSAIADISDCVELL